jgi:glycosyltransferase involved in cell wall biosynthesis
VSSNRDAKKIVCVPAFNESKSISHIFQKLKKYANEVIVHDGSKDDTYEVAMSEGATVIRNQENKTNGIAIRSLFQAAREQDVYTLIAFFKGKMKY